MIAYLLEHFSEGTALSISCLVAGIIAYRHLVHEVGERATNEHIENADKQIDLLRKEIRIIQETLTKVNGQVSKCEGKIEALSQNASILLCVSNLVDKLNNQMPARNNGNYQTNGREDIDG